MITSREVSPPLSYISIPTSRLCLLVQNQAECSKPERFDELTLAQFIDTIIVFLAEMENAAPINSKSKLEGRACFASFRGIFLKLRTVSFETLAEKLKAPFALHKKQGCRRQPFLLSMLDSLKPMQFGFFGSLGSLFPKKLPKSGRGVNPAYLFHSCR